VVEIREWMAQKVAYEQYMALPDDVSFIFMVAKNVKSHFP
jgi:hypothetical protein